MELSIDAVSDEPGLALSVAGVAALTATWHTQQNHSKELLPNIDRLLTEAGRTKRDIEAVFVDVGPGGYAALRVGVSIAKALAHGLGVPVVGIGRLELEAYAVAEAAGRRRIVAAHRAGRGDVASASYARDGAWTELSPPAMSKPDEMLAQLRGGDVITGDIDPAWQGALEAAGASVLTSDAHRVIALAALGRARLDAGRVDDAATLVPVYLRAPAIGGRPQD